MDSGPDSSSSIEMPPGSDDGDSTASPSSNTNGHKSLFASVLLPPPPANSPVYGECNIIPPTTNEDGYLGDCSSDGGNDKIVPLEKHALGCACTKCCSSYKIFASSVFTSCAGAYPQTQYHRKMRSHHRLSSNNWSHLKTVLADSRLRLACNTNNYMAASRILESGNTDPRACDEFGRTALHFSAAKGYSDIVRLLLMRGANPNQKDKMGNTALHLAACTNHIAVVTLLLRAGTNVASLDNNGRSPLQLAQSKLKMLQRSSRGGTGGAEMDQVKAEVMQVLEMMREYLSMQGDSMATSQYSSLIEMFSQKMSHQTSSDAFNLDLTDLLESLGSLTLQKQQQSDISQDKKDTSSSD